MFKDRTHILRQLKKGLGILLLLAIVAELFFFPSLANLYGCLMAAIAYGVFTLFLKEKYIRRYPFAFFMYVSMFMYRYLPLIATIAEGKPITYGFERPLETFMYEIMLFLISSLAFYLACSTSNTSGRNNVLQNTLHDLKFFETTPAIIWGMGLIGLVIRIYNFSVSDVEYGNVGGKFLLGLNYLMYAPLVLLFPSLLNLKYTKQKLVWLYAVLIFIINIASNSRQSIITPIGTIALLFFLYVVLNNIKITKLLSPLKIVTLGLGLFLILGFLSRISTAMLYTRAIRSDVSKLELFEETIAVLQNYELMKSLLSDKDKTVSALSSYQEGWTEEYVDNFMLARYANMRITDQTLFYAEKKGYANRQMQEAFKNSLVSLFPGPVLERFNVFIDKSTLFFSKGDLLYGQGTSSFIVTSHVADGLATFGYYYFLLQFFVTFLLFKLLNSFVYKSHNGFKYAPLALIDIFGFLGMFRNAQGIYGDMSYVIRGFLEGVVTYFIIFYIIKQLLWLFYPRPLKLQQ